VSSHLGVVPLRRRRALDLPMFDISFGVPCIDVPKSMRIDPQDARNHAVKGDWMFAIVFSQHGVVRQRRQSWQEQPQREKDERKNFLPHQVVPPLSASVVVLREPVTIVVVLSRFRRVPATQHAVDQYFPIASILSAGPESI